MYKFKIKPDDIKDLIKPIGYCYASDKITVDGEKVGFMYRETPYEKEDSGWRFLSGTEDDEYIDDPKNSFIFDVNVIANYDSAIIPYLEKNIGTELQRVDDKDAFIPLD
jgi:hypothetical protein